MDLCKGSVVGGARQFLTMILKALTYNLHKLYNVFGSRYVIDEIKPLLETLYLDFAFFQEIRGLHPQSHMSSYELDPLEHLADKLWDFAAYGKNAVYPSGHHGNAILSKFPIEEWQNYDLSQYALEQRGLLLARVTLPNQRKAFLACTHIDLTQWSRNRQIKKISEIFKSEIPEGQPLIFAGDFNDWNGKVSHHFEELGLTALPSAKTFPAKWPLLSLDKVFIDHLDVLKSGALTGRAWRALSDHLPIEFQLRA
jgi:endonuclease/exonuclease/phosphatase family metal-dependent hydrolase